MIERREFLQQTMGMGLGALVFGAVGGCGSQVGGRSASVSFAPKCRPKDLIKIGFVGIGNMGSGHVRNLLGIEGAQVTAVCDIRPERTDWAVKTIIESGFEKPAVYGRDEQDFVRMCETEDLDLVYNAAPWRYHTPICLAAMRNGKHAASEVNIAQTLEECWALVEMAEKTQRHCVMMENCCYDRTEMMIMNMIKAGLFGEIVHGEAGYLHDLRKLKFSPTTYQGMWRIQHSLTRNGNLYPTHGIGPMAWCMDIHHGDAFDTLVAVSTKSLGLPAYALEHHPEWADREFALGDVCICLIKTKLGKTLICKHDTNLPRPYSRDFLVQGVKGIARKYPDQRIHIEGRTKGHGWDKLQDYRDEFEHPVWKRLQEKAQGAGHGGMDYIEDYRLIQALRQGLAPDICVYDSVAWSAVTPLSEKSIAHGGQPVSFPDFTRGAWKLPRVLGVFESIL
ncbi:Gfo/Idh/MocA family protein [Planctomycetota bacterium]